VVDVAVLDPRGPLDVIHALDVLEVHRDALEPVRELDGDGVQIDPARLLEVGELGHLHPVAPDLPAQAPGAQRGRLPVVLDEPDVVLERLDAHRPQAVQVDLLDVLRAGLHDDLKLIIVLETVGVVAVAPVGRPPRRLDVRRVPRLGAEHAKERRRVEGPCADLEIVRLDDQAAALGPEALELHEELLERHGGVSLRAPAAARTPVPQSAGTVHRSRPGRQRGARPGSGSL